MKTMLCVEFNVAVPVSCPPSGAQAAPPAHVEGQKPRGKEGYGLIREEAS